MTLTFRIARGAAMFALVVALVATAAVKPAHGNHFILPCRDECEPGWVVTGNLNTPRAYHTATRLHDGKVLITGGVGAEGVLASAELYDPASGTWSVTGSMSAPRADHFAALLPTGAVVVIGGDQPCCLAHISAETYDPDTGTWSRAAETGPYGGLFRATVLPSGAIFVTGITAGRPYFNIYQTASWLYDPARQVWDEGRGDPVYRQYPSVTTLPDGTVLVTGGTNDVDLAVVAGGAELYSPYADVWATTGDPIVPRDSAAGTVLADGSVLRAGGVTATGSLYSPTVYATYLQSAEIYDASGAWRAAGDLNDRRTLHTATLLPDGKVFVTGGMRYSKDPSGNYLTVFPTTAELYDPGAQSWRLTASPNVARAEHTATLLEDGSVLVAGGVSDHGYLGSAELYLSVRTSIRTGLRHR